MTPKTLHANIKLMGRLSDGIKGLKEGLRHAFSLHRGEALGEEELALIKRLAKGIVRRRMAAPAVLFLESLEPLSYIGSQAMSFFRPFVTLLFSPEEYDRLTHILERRNGIETLIEEIKKAEEDYSEQGESNGT